MKELRFAIFGTGFWSQFQLAAWREITGARCAALFNRTRSKAEALAERFHVPRTYDDPEKLLDQEQLDFVDIITDVGSHARLVMLAAQRGVAVICQKPMAPDLDTARQMVEACRRANVPFFIHENWRWQTPLRAVKQLLDSRVIGAVFRARVDFNSSFPVFDNQPFLKELDQFILTDIGSHILDVSRFLFGEASSLACRTHRIHQEIRGEDVATVLMTMGKDVTVVCNMSYASRTEHERFPETYLFIEGEKGSIELGPDYWIRVTTETGTLARRAPPPHYSWADPAYSLTHSSIVPCHQNLFDALKRACPAETTAEDNLKTVELVFKAYASAQAAQI